MVSISNCTGHVFGAPIYPCFVRHSKPCITRSCCAGFVTKLSSAGLVYKHFGKQLVAAALDKQQDSDDVQTTWLAVYKYFMEAIDGIDNGMPICNCYAMCFFRPRHLTLPKWITVKQQSQLVTCAYMVHTIAVHAYKAYLT